VNDIGYERHSSIVWQTLAVCGDCAYFDELFKPSLQLLSSSPQPELTKEQLEEQDRLLALSLAQDQDGAVGVRGSQEQEKSYTRPESE